MKKTQLLTLGQDILISTTKTCILFMVSTAISQVSRSTTKETSERFIQGYKFIKNRYIK